MGDFQEHGRATRQRAGSRAMRRVAGVAVLVLATACGSTVQLSSRAPGEPGLGPTDQDGFEGGTTGGTTPSGTTGSPDAPGTSGSGGTGTGPDGRGSSPTLPTTPTSPIPSVSGHGLGVTAKTITIGIMYQTNGDAANAAIGASGLTQGDTLADAKALVADVNAHGGIAGRKLVAVYHATNVQSQEPRAAQDQAACSDFTQDHKVIAVLGTNQTDTLTACLRKAGVVFLKGGTIMFEDSTYLRQHPNEFLLGTLAQERALRDQVGSFARQGWYGGWDTVRGAPASTPAKLGVITYDEPNFHRSLRGTLLPALRAAGHAPAEPDVFEIHTPTSSSDQAGSIAQLKNATLKLQQDRVTHVVLVDTSGGILELFASNARTQGYYPRLGLSSGDGAQAMHDTGLVQDKQLVGMAGNGWLPFLDLPAKDGAAHSTPATKRCLQIMKERTGQTFTSTNAASLALAYCDQVFLFTQGMRSARSLTPVGLVQAIEAIGAGFNSPVLPKAFFSPARHDAGVQAWDVSWVSSCSCVRYANPHQVA